MEGHRIYVGTSGWSVLSRPERRALGGPGPLLARYGRVFPAVEVNTTFYRSHRPGTYARWAELVPEGFRFAVKMPRWITHLGRLRRLDGLEPFLTEVRHLGPKLGPVLVQLPPSLRYDPEPVETFFAALRGLYDGPCACEGRHGSWFSEEAGAMLGRWRIARVVADPAPIPAEPEPGGCGELVYVRLHGRPRMYYSAYAPAELEAWIGRLLRWAKRGPVWCFFNNTASQEGLENARYTWERLQAECGSP
ncbi:MAG: DUF72 domain-containing protein [Bacteroidetes bacterium]|nr:DUF72 domain-containing protein [Bacteroidota bacterium]MDW8286039.1 DUF72 domain-containing protein [Bacteroidota bacterium]